MTDDERTKDLLKRAYHHIKSLEWSRTYTYYPCCPECSSRPKEYNNTHKEDCELNKVLKELEQYK